MACLRTSQMSAECRIKGAVVELFGAREKYSTTALLTIRQ